MKNLKKNISDKAILIITVPNDFSTLQKKTNKYTKKKYWISYPEHLNYFNQRGFEKFCKLLNFKIIHSISDYPIELFLLKKNFDYTRNKKVGKFIHLLRCEILSYLLKNKEINKIYDLFKSFYNLDIGRDNIYFVKKR